MEAQLKPEALEKFALITELFLAFEKIQTERLDFMSVGNDFPPTARSPISSCAKT
jgi:RNA polymerase primary sigma factor